MLDILIEKWDDILNNIKNDYEISDVAFKTWLLPLQVHSITDNTVNIVFNGQSMALNFIKKKYYDILKVTIDEFLDSELDIKFYVASQLDDSFFENQKTTQVNYNSVNLEQRIADSNLSPKYTFDTFVVGSNSNIAHAASLAVADSPGEMYNPLFIYGGVGLGKTHLMHAIGNFILENNPSAKVLYVTSEAFTNELVEIIRNDSGNQAAITNFRNKYRNIDVFMIDDIQFIIGKERTQEEFFHTFNTLYLAQKQIIISSDKPPKDIETLEERLRTRFSLGLTVDIQSPDYETRLAILAKKAEIEHYNIDPEIFKYIVENITSNVRELEGALKKIVAFSKLSNSKITIDFAKEVLKDFISPEDKKITSELIINTVAEHFGIAYADILSKKKNQEIAYPRQICMYLCRTLTDDSLKMIGNALNKKDHSTIIHGVDKIQKEIDSNPQTKNLIDVLKKKINPN